jgi:hypothetical protein
MPAGHVSYYFPSSQQKIIKQITSAFSASLMSEANGRWVSVCFLCFIRLLIILTGQQWSPILFPGLISASISFSFLKWSICVMLDWKSTFFTLTNCGKWFHKNILVVKYAKWRTHAKRTWLWFHPRGVQSTLMSNGILDIKIGYTFMSSCHFWALNLSKRGVLQRSQSVYRSVNYILYPRNDTCFICCGAALGLVLLYGLYFCHFSYYFMAKLQPPGVVSR